MKRLIVLLLAIACLCGCFAGCSNDKDNPAQTSPQNGSQAPSVTDEVTIPKRTYDDLTPVDFEGKKINIMTRDSASTILWRPIDWDSDGSDPADEISYAVFKRNTKVEEDFKCEIVQLEVSANTMTATANAAWMGQTMEYDLIVMPIITQINTMATGGFVRDLSTLQNMNGDDPWWNQNTNETLELFGRQFTVCGDVNIIDDMATWCILFNKYLVNDYGMENHYDLVNNGNWTWETMHANALEVADTMHETYGRGMYGICSEFDGATALLAAADMYTVQKTETEIINNVKSHKFEDVMSDIYDFMSDDNLHVYSDSVTNGSAGYSAVGWGVGYNIFKADTALYCMATVSNVLSAQLSDMASPMGILPFPKHTAEQKSYISTFQAGNATGVSIFSNFSEEDAENAMIILNAMSAASVDTLTPSFYDRVLLGRKVPDEESFGTLNIILNGRVADIGVIMNSSVRTVIASTVKKRDAYNFVSIRQENASAIETAFTNATNNILNNFKTEPEA